ncbi:hypothetical protein Lalb_Chr17g0335701 [Lupinus albus]|uniref:Uncharacterized protein n=1 Tax=Lupinus albus TaxID=3870 RepID=A0A6A4P0L6_LUPAL|nr:hypothetical protein Lalb_Chr17g0335701 [Lupinus albus]
MVQLQKMPLKFLTFLSIHKAFNYVTYPLSSFIWVHQFCVWVFLSYTIHTTYLWAITLSC